MSEVEHLSATVDDELAGQRLDKILAQIFSDYSRARLQQWVSDGVVLVDGKQLRSKDKLRGGEQIEITVELEEEVDSKPEAIPLDIVYEDESILVINKPVGLVVHPAAGNREGTMLNALLHHAPELAGVPRAGIVHRLDKETSGLLVVARTLKSQKVLTEQIQRREFEREYQTVVNGVMTAGGTVDAAIGRHPTVRTRMAVVGRGKEARTHYRVIKRYRAHTHVLVKLETGRTHQIRVHMAHVRYPIVGDPVYGGRLRIPKGCGEVLNGMLRTFKRQALHAAKLGLVHPESGEMVSWEAPLPTDMARLLQVLDEDLKLAE
ncbi:Ribosomal large subunit pseudouridine synthase D [hydrothermal vent metagenome]|uniref:Ribosomal large subunit pseudouridine synthase D n=1 Tax=hydrothermal vent metagenome TaxID=652676 RepID=A0A3B0Z4R5_9ZZZZ